jgi:hypothetical protein
MPSRFHWDCGSPNTAAVKVSGKPFLASGLCGRASGQQAATDLVIRVQDSSAWVSTLTTITHEENGGHWDHVPPPPISNPNRPRSGWWLSGRFHRLLHYDVERHHKAEMTPTGGRNVPPSCQCP